MNCPHCHTAASRVVETRDSQDGAGIRRRRECKDCGERFTTYERVETPGLQVVKRDGTAEAFDPDKVRAGIERACEKRPVDAETIDRITEEVAAELRSQGSRRVDSSTVGDLVIERLKKVDEVAYLRFASVYNDFDDASAFQEEAETLQTAESDASDAA